MTFTTFNSARVAI